MTQDEFLRRLDELRSRGRLIFLIGTPLALLLETPIIVYVLKVQLSMPPSRRTVALPLAGLTACFFIVAVFYLVVQRSIAKNSPLCPLCAGRITWRERASVLASGRCPHCSCELFRDSHS